MAKDKIVSDYYVTRPQTRGQDVPNKIVCGLQAGLFIESPANQAINAQTGQSPGLAAKWRQPKGWCIGLEQVPRMRLESQSQGWAPNKVSQGTALFDQGLMAPVNSIEITDGDRATFQFFRKRRNMTNDTHDADYWDLCRRWQLISSNIIQMPRERG